MLLDEGVGDFQVAEEAEAELGIRKRAAEACQKTFQALVVLTDVLLAQHDVREEDHGGRMRALRDVGRGDLADLYERAFGSLHVLGYYRQQVGPLQRDRIQEVKRVVEGELEKLA